MFIHVTSPKRFSIKTDVDINYNYERVLCSTYLTKLAR